MHIYCSSRTCSSKLCLTFHEPLILRLSEIRPVLWFLTEEVLVDPSTWTNLDKFEPGTNDRDYVSSLIVFERVRTDLVFCTPPRFINLLISSWGKPGTVPECVAIYEVYQVSYAYDTWYTYVRRLCMSSYVGIVHTAAVELVVWGYEVYLAQQTKPGPRNRES